MRTHEMASFLRSRRERLTPADVGLPATGRRRTPGLRREELAMIAGISTTWYTYLEQGREVRPSDQVLHALAGALRLPDHERDHLLHLAGSLTAPPVDDSESLPPGAAAMPGLLEPHPAYVTGARYDVLAFNAAAAALFTGLAATEHPNVARWILTDPEAREVLVDWEHEAQSVLARVRAVAGKHPDDPRVAALVEALHADSAEVRAWWPRYDLAESRSGSKRLRHPELGVVTLEHTAFHVAGRPEQTLVVYSDPRAVSRPGREDDGAPVPEVPVTTRPFPVPE